MCNIVYRISDSFIPGYYTVSSCNGTQCCQILADEIIKFASKRTLPKNKRTKDFMSELEEDNTEEYDVDEDYDYDFEEYQDALDYCEECRIYGDNYYTDEDEDLILRCPKCNMNPDRLDDDYID